MPHSAGSASGSATRSLTRYGLSAGRWTAGGSLTTALTASEVDSEPPTELMVSLVSAIANLDEGCAWATRLMPLPAGTTLPAGASIGRPHGPIRVGVHPSS